MSRQLKMDVFLVTIPPKSPPKKLENGSPPPIPPSFCNASSPPRSYNFRFSGSDRASYAAPKS